MCGCAASGDEWPHYLSLCPIWNTVVSIVQVEHPRDKIERINFLMTDEADIDHTVLVFRIYHQLKAHAASGGTFTRKAPEDITSAKIIASSI